MRDWLFRQMHFGDQPQFMPTRQGFDEYQGIPYSNVIWVKGNPKRNFPPLPWMKRGKPVEHCPQRSCDVRLIGFWFKKLRHSL